MDKCNLYRIEIRAAQELSKKSGSTGIITLEHYRLAASIVVQKLAMAVQGTDPEDDHQESA